MDALFLKLVNMSITASYFVLGVILLRILLRKTPKWILVLLWGLVGLRLLLPFSIESKQSLIPSTEPISQQILGEPQPVMQSGIPFSGEFADPVFTEPLAPQPGTTVTPAQHYIAVAANIWILGMVLMAAYCLFTYFRLRRSLREAIPYKDNIWCCDRLPSPFCLGLFRPRIYIPSDLCEEDLPYVLAHERAHIQRRDHWWKPLGYLLLTVYWFNPLLWLAYILLCRDIEGACDERVLRELGQEGKKTYSQSLLRCSIPKRQLSACPLAFGEGNLKGRISSILSYKKPTLWILILALIATTVLSVWFLTDPAPSYEDCWFDFLQEDYASEYYKIQLPQEVPGHPELYIKISNNRLVVVEDGKSQVPFPNRYMFNGFFADLNQDGSPELCCSGFTHGEGYLWSDPSAYVYDFVTGESYYASQDLPFGAYHFALVEGTVTLCSSDFNSGQISSDIHSQLQGNLKLLRDAAILSYSEPLLVRDDRSGTTVFARRTQEALFPFYLSWEGERLSEMNDEELTAFLSASISDTGRISVPQLETARFVTREVEKDPDNRLHFAAEAFWELKVYRAALEYYGHPLASSLPFRDEELTLSRVIELSHKGESLTWEDLYSYKATDIGSGLYVMKFIINDRYTLQCSDGKLTGSPMTAYLIDSQTGLSIDIRRDLVEGFLRTPTYEKWFDSPGYVEPLTLAHPTISDLRFTFDGSTSMVSLETDKGHEDVVYDGKVLNAYFADVTLDGVADLCCSYVLNYGTSAAGIVYYDPVNMTTHHIRDAMGYQYALIEREGLLQLRISTASNPRKEEYYDLRTIATGNIPDPMNIGELTEKFPQYFNLDTQHGLVLYVNEYNSEAYACRLISHPGTSVLPEIDLTQLAPCSYSQMVRILSTYGNIESPLHIVAVDTTYSTLNYATEEEYAQAIQALFDPATQSLYPISIHSGN